MSAIHFHSFSRAYNEWLDYVSDFRVDFDDSQEFKSVLNVIVHLLNRKLNHPADDPEHPFRRYADKEKTMEENYEVLAGDVMSQVQDVFLRGYVVAFFHTGGANYEDMKELMEEFFLFADRSEDEDYSDSSTVSDEYAEQHVYEDEDDQPNQDADYQPNQDAEHPAQGNAEEAEWVEDETDEEDEEREEDD